MNSTRPGASLLGVAALLLVLAAAVSSSSAFPLRAQEAKPAPSSAALLKAASEHRSAMNKAAVVEKTQGRLGVRIRFFENAWHYWVIQALETGLEAKQSLTTITEQLRKDRKLQRQLKGKTAIQVEFLHPGFEEDGDEEKRQPIHFFAAPLAGAVKLKAGEKGVAWKLWQPPVGLEAVRVRIGRHNTVRNGRLVPFISPLKPDRQRAVFRGTEAASWGLIPPSALKKKNRRVKVSVAYDEFFGLYDDRHIIDLNDDENLFERELELELEKPLPLFFPTLPTILREFIEGLGKK